MTAEEIAEGIAAVVDATLQDEVSTLYCSETTKILWNKARELGIETEVVQILHKESMDEIHKLMAETLRRFKYTFMDRLRAGEVKDLEKLAEESVKHWHECDEPCSLQEWLGMSAAEYEQFVLDPQALYNKVATTQES